jgi:phosphatidylglycerophosphatase A
MNSQHGYNLERAPRLASFIATVGGIGHSRIAPGTMGSLVAILPAWALLVSYGTLGPLTFTVVVFAVGYWASDIYVLAGRVDDPKEIVIDEVAGQALTITFLPATSHPLWIAAAFVAFRFFDILKPWPVNLAERRLQDGLGVMADDIVAALYAGLVLLGVKWLFTVVTT